VRYKGILLDLDNTLYPYVITHERALDAVADVGSHSLAISPHEIRMLYKQARDEIGEALSGTAASHHRLLYFQRMMELKSIHDLTIPLKLYNCYWDAFLQAMTLDAGVREFFEAVKDVPVCCVTDLTAHIQYRKLMRLNLMSSITYLVTSEEAGCEKPEEGIFKRALGKMKLSASQVCMIGDNYERDILGAQSMGMASIWLNREGIQRDLPEMVEAVTRFSEIKRRCLC